ncbi:MAG: hypothetical protein ABI068_05115 [Ktedonobacterales bacterium]
MAVSVRTLEQRQLERLRAELGEVIAVGFAYPPFFDFRANRLAARPVDRAKRDEIALFLNSFNFDPLMQCDVNAPELRRFVERLLLRYLEVNEAFARPRHKRLLPGLRAHAARVAAETQRHLQAHLNGSAQGFGVRRAAPSWAVGSDQQSRTPPEERAHNTRILEAILLRTEAESGSASGPAGASLSSQSPQRGPATPAQRPGARWGESWAGQPTGDLTVPVSAQDFARANLAAGGRSPFEALGTGAQSGALRDATPIADQPTGPLATFHPATGNHQQGGASGARDVPAELYQLYSDYLSDMQPDPTPPPLVFTAPPPPPQGQSGPFGQPPYQPSQPQRPAMRDAGQAPHPTPQANQGAPSNNPRSDKLIFWQLRYQLEAYIRRAAFSYGVPNRGGDPASVLDALRRSGFVDEADLRIAEGIFALTDRVTAGSAASVEDYQQALMLYLLYHRSHLG